MGKQDIHGFTGVRTTPWWVAGVIATGGHMVIALLAPCMRPQNDYINHVNQGVLGGVHE